MNVKVKSFGIDDWRGTHLDATFETFKALELTEDINSDSRDYAIKKTELEKQFCIISDGHYVYDHVRSQTVSTYAFTHVAASQYEYVDINGKARSVAERWLKDLGRLTYERVVLDPAGTPVGCLNLFKGFAVTQAVEGDTGWWDGSEGLLMHVIPDETVRVAIERTLAWPFANPKQWKVFHAPVITGAHGIGKDQLTEAICRLIGEHHVKRIDGTHIASPYDGFLANALFVKVEEADVGRSGANKVKRWITSPTHVLNPKCDRQIKIVNNTNFAFSSNDVNPMFIGSDTERRYLVYESPADPMSEKMANLVAAKVSDPVALSALLYRFKHQVNFEGFSPHAPAMKTKAFFDLANDTSLSDVDRFVDRMINNPDGKLRTSDIWRAADITEAMPEELRRRPGAETALTRAMGSLRFKDHIRRIGLVSVKGDKLRLWAVRNGPKWEQRGSAAVAAEYLRANPQTGQEYKAPKYTHSSAGSEL